MINYIFLLHYYYYLFYYIIVCFINYVLQGYLKL